MINATITLLATPLNAENGRAIDLPASVPQVETGLQLLEHSPCFHQVAGITLDERHGNSFFLGPFFHLFMMLINVFLAGIVLGKTAQFDLVLGAFLWSHQLPAISVALVAGPTPGLGHGSGC